VELGCGTGRNLHHLVSRGTLRAIGADLSAGMLDAARRRPLEARWIRADLSAGEPLELLDGCADLVLICLMLEHVADLDPVFAEAARLLADGGQLRVIELHPDAADRGSRARIEVDGVRHTTAWHAHDLADLRAAASRAGLVASSARDVHPTDEIAARYPSTRRPQGVPWLLDASWTRGTRAGPVRYDPASLPRREAFAFFSGFGSPTFELTVDVPLGDLRARCTRAGRPFHLVALHAAVRALEAVPELMLRIEGEAVLRHHQLRIGATCMDHAERLGFTYYRAHAELDAFIAAAREATARGRERARMVSTTTSDAVFFSNLPWLSFRSITHADSLDPQASVPRLTFGRTHETLQGEALPVSLSVHHALADGVHVSWFFGFLQHHLEGAVRGDGAGRA
jgi:chloramphenicol O-acetyltransferase type A